MHTANDVLAALRSVPMTTAEIREAWSILKGRHTQAAYFEAGQFRFGEKVRFMHKGAVMEGNVTKINHKTVGVNVHGRDWRVSPSLLTKVS